MITHRMSTQSGDPSAKWYKLVAVSFLLITVLLLGVIIFITSKKADITIVAKEDAKKVNLTVTVSGNKKPGTIAGTVTSTVFGWAESYQPTGTKTVAGTSKGQVTVYNKTGTDQPLVKTTRLLNANGVLFRLASTVNAPAHGEVTVSVYADQTGASSDIEPGLFTIPGLVEAKQKTIYAESKTAMTGGAATVNVLSEDDITSAMGNYKEKVKQAFLQKYTNTSTEVSVSMSDQAIKASAKAGDQVANFSISGTSTLIIVSYSEKDLADKVINQVSDKIDPTAERFLTTNKRPSVTVATFSIKDGTADLNVSQDALVTLDVNVEKLAPTHFVGKSKDEINRYILGLDHVVGVDIKFSPSWLSTAPTVPDRIRVVVKNVQ